MVRVRVATAADLPALNALIEQSARSLSRGYYSPAQTEGAIREIFGADSRLIADGTYFAAEDDEILAGCGGWSRRKTLYGGDQTKTGEEAFLDPSRDAARIRAFFVHPDHARRGVGTQILNACTDAARVAGFRRLELAATLPGVPFYRALGFEDRERIEISMGNGLTLPVLRMERSLDGP